MANILLTGQTRFMDDIHDVVENYIEGNYVLLTHSSEANLAYWLGWCNAVIMPGGVDIHPVTYGDDVVYGKNLTRFDIARDYRELSVLEHCKKNDIPVLGICRGHQMIGIAHGSKLDKDLRTNVGIAHGPGPDMEMPPNAPAHSIKFLDDSIGYVNSFHHQGIRRSCVGKDLRIVATAADGVVEAMEHRNARIVSVQWHPEADFRHNPVSAEVFRQFTNWL